jgi:pimeloyl-ACP methyl ester carboxylesterase
MGKIESWAPVYLNFMKTRKVYVIDFPGQSGKSDELKEAWGVPEYSEMTKSFISEQKIEGCDVIGHSFGGRVIIYLASRYESLFSRIVLSDSAGIKPKMTIKKFFRIYSYKIVKNIYKLFLSKEKYEAKIAKAREKRASKDYVMLDTDIKRETFKKIVNLDLTSCLKGIKNPTLLIWGENDQDTPLYMAHKMDKLIPDSGLVIIESAGHFSYLDNPKKFLVVTNEFLK